MTRISTALLGATALLAASAMPAAAFDSLRNFTPLPAASTIAACPAGKVRCADWCGARPWLKTCMTGHPNSCDKKRGGANACVSWIIREDVKEVA
ncbi:MAG: hypothetical protein JO019_03915 [Candidatus Kaiserbacteria bacterium]|nr:hypothetical protein [Candidatus Kaiserbacteria bacterium]